MTTPPEGAAVASSSSVGARGTIRITPAVLIDVVELSARAVPGVLDVQPRRRVERILPRAGHGVGGHQRGKAAERGGVKVRVDGGRIDVDVSIIVARGVNIMALSRLVQRTIGGAFDRTLEMTVTEVNVYVAEIGTETA